MGLDNFWKLPSSLDKHPTFNPPLNLWGGLCSNHGCESFRGKMYSEFCDAVMDLNLFQDLITNAELKVGLQKLSTWMKNNSSWRDHDENEISDLFRMFNTYVNLGASLESWY